NLKELATFLEKIFNHKIRIIYLPMGFSKLLKLLPFINRDLLDEMGCNWKMSIDKLKRDFSFTPKSNFKEILLQILRNYDLLKIS
ncbi:MAG: hypothetical protein NC936_02650, partial [Candidatus Omnitrophica bacterium]|nr:hypothetical protein [Candidatus Omnitrophota bacterium]